MSTRFGKDAAMFRRSVIAGLAALMLMPAGAQAQQMPSSQQIERQLDAGPRQRVRPQDRVTIDQLRRRPDLRRQAPSIDIQSINFAFGSAEIPRSQVDKVETIARALRQLSRRGGRDATILIEGHTDAVGSFAANQRLSEARAASLRRVLVRDFGIRPRMLETVGYGEEFLLINTQQEDWRNRRVTLRRVDDFLRP
jgi:outer membrane protein OmpA-like peptidoglycan-associated protein